MHVLVLSCEPGSRAPRDERDELAPLLDQLGCRISERVMNHGVWEAKSAPEAVDIAIIDAGDDMGAARRAIEALRGDERFATLPVLLAVGVSRVSGLDFELGFADFVLRPFVPAEVYARLRQIDHRTSAFGSDEVIKLGDLCIDLRGREVRVGQRVIALTPQEFELLRFLGENLGRALEREEILRKVWSYAAGAATRTVDIHIRRLRAKLGPPWDERIETVRHVGYKLRR